MKKKVTAEIEIDLHPRELAKMFMEMSARSQAMFFSQCFMTAKEWEGGAHKAMARQMDFVLEEANGNAINAMKAIAKSIRKSNSKT